MILQIMYSLDVLRGNGITDLHVLLRENARKKGVIDQIIAVRAENGELRLVVDREKLKKGGEGFATATWEDALGLEIRREMELLLCYREEI